jgi:hypothetical protein
MARSGGIIDKEKNPFANKDWIKQGFGLTLHRQKQLKLLFGKRIHQISRIKRNEGAYPAFVGIRWGFACIKNDILEPTSNWHHSGLYSEYGERLTLKTSVALVQSWNDILSNIQILEAYRYSKNNEDVKFYNDLVKRGTCFVATKTEENLVFAPSRFIGYLKNNRKKHITNESKDGRVTNPAIETILESKFRVDEGLERAYRSFCLSLGFAANEKGSFGVTRKYILKGAFPFVPKDFVLDDISEIEKQKDIDKTEKQQLVNARLGQGVFRESLLKLWGGCSVSGCSEPTMLRASHIKPWRLSSNKERLDPYNGLLLTPNFDLAFDNGLISFDPDGKIMISDALDSNDADVLGLSRSSKINLHHKNKAYMEYHRTNIFKK